MPQVWLKMLKEGLAFEEADLRALVKARPLQGAGMGAAGVKREFKRPVHATQIHGGTGLLMQRLQMIGRRHRIEIDGNPTLWVKTQRVASPLVGAGTVVIVTGEHDPEWRLELGGQSPGFFSRRRCVAQVNQLHAVGRGH